MTSPAGSDATAYMVGATVPVTKALTLLASYQSRNGKPLTAGGAEADRVVMSIGGTYALSNRSNFYFSYGDSNGKKALDNTSADFRQYTVGLAHRF